MSAHILFLKKKLFIFNWASLVAQTVNNLPAGLGRSPGEGNGNPLQYSCMGNPMDRGAWRATVHTVTKSQI